MKFSAFTRFGHLRYSGRKPVGQVIYESLKESFGDTYDEDFNSRQQARLYAQAMCLASANLQLERAANNRNPLKATELLAELERDYQISPQYDATLPERRAQVAARARINRGSREDALREALRLLLGDGLVDLRTNASVDSISWPADPGDVGVYTSPGTAPKTLVIEDPISVTGVPLVVQFTMLVGELPVVGESYCVDPDSRGAPESITVAAVGDGELTATFARAHEAGTVATRPHPLWISTQRAMSVVVTLDVATDPEKRRQIHELMARGVRGVTQWGITCDLGSLMPDDPVLSDPRVALPA